MANNLFIHERVTLSKQAQPRWPDLKNVVGTIVREESRIFLGRCMVVKFPIGERQKWLYLLPTDLNSAEHGSGKDVHQEQEESRVAGVDAVTFV